MVTDHHDTGKERGFSATRLAGELFGRFGLTGDRRLFVAFSGGLDSTALLHALVSIERVRAQTVTALHVNHGLHEHADAWEHACRRFCAARGVGYESAKIFVGGAGQGLEAAARRERYRWLAAKMTPGSVLLTAHHLDDQAETVLANLFRGAGPHGLAGMRRIRPLGDGEIWRPMLDVERRELSEYVRQQGLDWIDDPANEDLRYTRNYLRRVVVPTLRARWPAVTKTVARASRNWRNTVDLLDEVADGDLKGVPHRDVSGASMISAAALSRLTAHRRANLLRHWFRRCGFQAPARKDLNRLQNDLLEVQPPPTAVCRWSGVELRRYRDWLFLSRPDTGTALPAVTDWPRGVAATLMVGDRKLRAVPATGTGIRRDLFDRERLTIRRRVGGEWCRPQHDGRRRKLKKLLQEAGIPPWQRDRIPLLYVNEELAGVVGLCYCFPFAATGGEPGIVFEMCDD